MLPRSLWLLLTAMLAAAQSRQSLSLESIQGFDEPVVLSIPSSNSNLTVSVALCGNEATPKFFITNTSSTENDPGPGGGTGFVEIDITDGYAHFEAPFVNGGVLAVEMSGAADVGFEVGVSTGGPLHEIMDSKPYLGDTTNNQAIIFSPPVWQSSTMIPTYPNYTLPPANLSVLDDSFVQSNFSIFVTRTSSQPSLLTSCALKLQDSAARVMDERLWLKDSEGWRNQWTLEGLAPQTNYTAYVTVDDSKVSGPLYFVTKSASFSCPLLSQLPYCPGVAYAVPLPVPPGAATTYDANNLPSSIAEPIISSLTNFTTTLTTFACGRDNYSPLVTCADCQREYRRWLCAISFPRCGEESPSTDTTTEGAQRIFTALATQTTESVQRNTNFPAFNQSYEVLLPCLERCHAMDRACPTFLGLKCPAPRFHANESYGVGFVDTGEEGDEGNGSTGAAQDIFGNVWCNWG